MDQASIQGPDLHYSYDLESLDCDPDRPAFLNLPKLIHMTMTHDHSNYLS